MGQPTEHTAQQAPDPGKTLREEMTAGRMQRMTLHDAADFALHMPNRPKVNGHNALCGLCTGCTLCRACTMCERCTDCDRCYFCRECTLCKDCFGCVGLTAQQYAVFNVVLPQEQYERLMKKWGVTTDAEVTPL